MKKIYIKILPVVLLLLTLLFTLGVWVYAEDTENYLLTVNYDEGCETVYYSFDGGAQQAMTSGTAYKIPKTATNVKLELKLKRGYELAAATGNKGSDYFERSNIYNYGIGFTSDDTITVTSVAKRTMLTDVMEKAKEKGDFTYEMSGGMITSINGVANPADWSKCWMLYTSDAEMSNTAWGTITWNGETLGSAVVGADALDVIAGATYVWSYQSF